jgi:hypothetical protein
VPDAEHEDPEVIWLDPLDGPTPPALTTGNPEDDQLLRQIAARVPLDEPREWIHYVFAPDEPRAQMVAWQLRQVAYEEVGFEVEIYPPDSAGEPYNVIATRERTILTADLVRGARELFELVTAQVPGAEYDGWEVAIDEDE